MSVRGTTSVKRTRSLALRGPPTQHLLNAPHTSIQTEDILVGNEIQMTAAISGVVPDDTFNVAEAVDALGFGKFQLVLSFVVGMCWMADSMEVMILSILSPALHCDWGIGQLGQAILTTSVFAGMTLGSPFWGQFSDKFGRRPSLLLSGLSLFFYGLLSAFSPTFNWILFLRFLVGVAIGCVPQSVTLFSEFLPTRQRGKCVVLLDCFWAFGACLQVLLAAVIMPLGGWRWLLAVSALPSLAFSVACATWMPESVRFNAASGSANEALETLGNVTFSFYSPLYDRLPPSSIAERIANENRKPMLLGRLTVEDISGGGLSDRGRFSDLLRPDLRRTTISLWIIWAFCSFIYYGIVLATTEMFESPGDDMCNLSQGSDGDLLGPKLCSAMCSPLDSYDYQHLLWTTLAEFPGIFLTMALIERFGRRRTLSVEFSLLALGLCFLFKCDWSRSGVTAILFMIRAIASGVFQAAYVYTPEVYPTLLRSVGVGACSAMARLGAVITPYFAQVLLRTEINLAVSTYVMAAVIAAVATLMLPMETKGKKLSDTNG